MSIVKRLRISMTPDFEEKILRVKEKHGYEDLPMSQVARILIEKGIEKEAEEEA